MRSSKSIDVIEKIKEIKSELKNDGFVIDAIFGSFLKKEFDKCNDIDLLYHLESGFFEKYSGFVGFKRLDIIESSADFPLPLSPLKKINSFSFISKDIS